MISFDIDSGTFNFRVAGILIQNNKVLVHRLIQDDFYAFPGGRVEMFEDTEATIIREMKEELDIAVKVERLLWVSEHFFKHNNKHYHELCFYYLIEYKDGSILEQGDCFNVVEGSNTFEFRWVSLDELNDEAIYPTFVRTRLKQLPLTIERVIDTD